MLLVFALGCNGSIYYFMAVAFKNGLRLFIVSGLGSCTLSNMHFSPITFHLYLPS